MRIEFTALLWRHESETAAWHFVTLPTDVADEIDDAHGPAGRRGFGSIRVEAAVGDSVWRTSIFPSKEHASFVLPMKQAVRVAEGLDAGDEVTVVLQPLDPTVR